jgi:hypothetical protein
MTTRQYLIGVSLGFLGALLSAAVCLYGLVAIGSYTGAFGICGTGAPDWWINSFHILFFVLVPTIPTVIYFEDIGELPHKSSNQPMKPTAPLRCNFSEVVAAPCGGLSLSC